MERTTRNKNTYKRYLFYILAVVLVVVATCYWQMQIAPTIDDIAKIKANSMINQLANEALNEQFSKKRDATSLLTIITNNEGNIELVQANTNAINQLVTSLLKEMQKRYSAMEEQEVMVPLGSLLGNKILSETRPYITLKVLPISVSGMDFRTEFETQGINQTKYKVYAVFTSKTKVMAPLSKNIFEVSSSVLIAEAIILGKVPNSYVMVPKEDILDVTEE